MVPGWEEERRRRRNDFPCSRWLFNAEETPLFPAYKQILTYLLFSLSSAFVAFSFSFCQRAFFYFFFFLLLSYFAREEVKGTEQTVTRNLDSREGIFVMDWWCISAKSTKVFSCLILTSPKCVCIGREIRRRWINNLVWETSGGKNFFLGEGDLQTRIGLFGEDILSLLLQHLPVLTETHLFLIQLKFPENILFCKKLIFFESRTKSAFLFAPFSARRGEGGMLFCRPPPSFLSPFFRFCFSHPPPPSFLGNEDKWLPLLFPFFSCDEAGFSGIGEGRVRGGDLDGLKMYISFFFALFQGAALALEPRIRIHSWSKKFMYFSSF